jgi:hypothetical protein
MNKYITLILNSRKLCAVFNFILSGRLPVNNFSWILIFMTFTKFCQHTQSMRKTVQKWRTLAIKVLKNLVLNPLHIYRTVKLV